MKLTAGEIAEAIGGELLCGDRDTILRNISTDSKTMNGDDLFIPLIGARVDGHRFIKDALNHGAKASLSSEGIPEELKQDPASVLIGTEDTMAALQRLGTWYRLNKVKIPYIGVTGSVGKTTTRAMIAAALRGGRRVYVTKGNANSQSGVPITVTQTDPEAEIGVIEMGISEFGEMHRISEVVRCDMAVVTVIGISHIANLKTRENIMIEKLHILDGMRDGGTLLLNGDDDLLKDVTLEKLRSYGLCEDKEIRIVFYGTGSNAGVRADNILDDGGMPSFDLVMDAALLPGQEGSGEDLRRHVCLQVPGKHMVLNALAAAAAAVLNGVDPDAAIRGLEAFETLDGRGKVSKAGGVAIINDAYNAAPQSMKAGLEVLDRAPGEGRHIAVLADMLELGPEEQAYHKEVGSFIASCAKRVSEVWLLGSLAEKIGEGILEAAAGDRIRLRYFEDVKAIPGELAGYLEPGDTVLFKGSHSMKLSEAAEAVREALQQKDDRM